MTQGNWHAFPRLSSWTVRRTGAKRALRLYASPSDAWDEAKRMAQKEGGTAYLHDAEGRITARERFADQVDCSQSESTSA